MNKARAVTSELILVENALDRTEGNEKNGDVLILSVTKRAFTVSSFITGAVEMMINIDASTDSQSLLMSTSFFVCTAFTAMTVELLPS